MLSEVESLYQFVIDAETVKCRKCGIEVSCTWENFAIGSQTPIVICPECLDMLAVKWGQHWIPPERFLKVKTRRNGLLPVKTPRERLILKILSFMAGKENSEFCLGIDASKCVILWVNGFPWARLVCHVLKRLPKPGSAMPDGRKQRGE